jgi:hypothetical protein
MRYGISINDDKSFAGDRETVQAMIAGAMLATGFDAANGDITAMEKAGFVLNLADGLGLNDTQGLVLGDDGELQVWRERGREAPSRAYLVRVGDIAPAFRATSQSLLVAYVMALMVADGVHPDKAGALGELVANTLSEGGHYPNRIVTELRDGRDVLAWWEDEA